jgi:hypothetical protein
MQISLAEFERTVSVDRFKRYRDMADNDHEAVCLYLWNLELSQELYAVLSSLEIALRNTIHAAGTAHFGRDDWFREPLCVQHFDNQQSMINGAKYKYWENKIGKQAAKVQKNTLGWPPVGDHIAQLMFGFWGSLMNAPYEPLLWDPNKTPQGPNLSQTAFPHASRANRKRAVIGPIVEELLKLRNRISHGEPILWWHPPVEAHYQNAIKVLSWISPAPASLLTFVDHFSTAYGQGHSNYDGLFTLVP